MDFSKPPFSDLPSSEAPSTPPIDPAPIVEAATGLFNTGSEIVKTILEHGGDLSDEAAGRLTGVLTLLEGSVKNVLGGVSTVLDKLKEVNTAIPKVPPVDVNETMKQIAAAVTAAESEINKYNLIITDATIDVELKVKLPGDNSDSGAQTRLHFEIKPKGYS